MFLNRGDLHFPPKKIDFKGKQRNKNKASHTYFVPMEIIVYDLSYYIPSRFNIYMVHISQLILGEERVSYIPL